MVRTQIQLTEQQIAALKTKAALEGVSMAELIRRGVNLVLDSSASTDTAERIRRAITVAGSFRSGLTDLSGNHDKYLTEAFQE
ncbi:MAG: ribbon-helix-helix protein, CopG family [Bacillota bacterium]